MASWLSQLINPDDVKRAQGLAEHDLLANSLGIETSKFDDDFRFVAGSLELLAFDLLSTEEQVGQELRETAASLFKLLRVMPLPEDPLKKAEQLISLSAWGILGDRGIDVARFLEENPWLDLELSSGDWRDRTYVTILDVWLRLFRKSGWDDLQSVQDGVVKLRDEQKVFELEYLNNNKTQLAWELVALYHLARAAEIVAVYTSQGEVDGHFDVKEQLESHFDRVISACSKVDLIHLETMARLLAKTAEQLINNCIWTITRAVSSNVGKFVKSLAHKDRKKPIFEMFPPQRTTLREHGLLGAAHRALVINLPTSSGKTLIAEFRILQALNQFDNERGWVAYLAPTRALVNQVCSQLRRDFSDLGINVERVSPALEIDGFESSLLQDRDSKSAFGVLVTTPEKLDLMIRGGWEKKIGRPLTLVVVDEAHNLKQKGRGLRLELLIATINRDCKNAQFLLLTPFVENAGDIARWLSGDGGKDIHLSVDWRPNDLAIALSTPRSNPSDKRDFELVLQTVFTNKHTLTTPAELVLASDRPLGLTYKKVQDQIDLAAATAQALRKRGPVLILAGRPDWCWGLARRFKSTQKSPKADTEQVQIVKQFIAEEFGEDFELIDFIDKGVGLHHSGLSDECKTLIEWLVREGCIDVLVATTTIAQGINFPLSSVSIAHNKYYDSRRGMVDMPAEDFWNLVGRVGRAGQSDLGLVALAAPTPERASDLREFALYKACELSSSLVEMVLEALMAKDTLDLHHKFNEPEWSSFLQFLAHTYRQVDNIQTFTSQVDQILRGTLGFRTLRANHRAYSQKLIESVEAYARRISNKPLALVDSTGFSWESINVSLMAINEVKISPEVWSSDLFTKQNTDLSKLVGVMLKVPELREQLVSISGTKIPDSGRISAILSDWVNGASLPVLAETYFRADNKQQDAEKTRAMTECCSKIFGKLIQTASWGLSAMQAMSTPRELAQMSEAEQSSFRNIPARVFYGVNSDNAIAMRLLGVPRQAAAPLAESFQGSIDKVPLSQVRRLLVEDGEVRWTRALGTDKGRTLFKVWKVLEAL